MNGNSSSRSGGWVPFVAGVLFVLLGPFTDGGFLILILGGAFALLGGFMIWGPKSQPPTEPSNEPAGDSGPTYPDAPHPPDMGPPQRRDPDTYYRPDAHS